MKFARSAVFVILFGLASGNAFPATMFAVFLPMPGWIEGYSIVILDESHVQLFAEASAQLLEEGSRIDTAENYCVRPGLPQPITCLARVVEWTPSWGCEYCLCMQGIAWPPLTTGSNYCQACMVHVGTCSPFLSGFCL